MRQTNLIIILLVLMFSIFGFSASNENLNTILDLETKLTTKIRSILQPIDPEAIVIAKVQIEKINTELAGTQMSAVGILSTADVQTVEEKDLQSIEVQIISTLNPFPPDVKKLVEVTLSAFSKKSRVRVVQMTESMSKALLEGQKNRSDLAEKSRVGWQKTSELAEQLTQLTKQVPTFAEGIKTNILYLILQILVVYSLIQGAIVFLQRRFQGGSVKLLREALSNLNINSTSKNAEDPEASIPIKIPGTEAQASGSGNLNGSITTKDNPIEQMYIQLIRDLMADCYWCHKDRYAAWVWSQLSPPKRMELLESWEPMIYYVKYFTHLEPQMDNYHLDPIYLKPREYFMHSNDDLLEIIRTAPYLWGDISILRQRAFHITLKERIDFMTAASKARPEKAFEWPYTPSKLRVLRTQLEVSEMSVEDESMIVQDPSMIPDGYRDNLHSLIWTAMLPSDERDKLLQKLPAQVLAEIWIGPEEVLARLNEVLPSKKQELLKSYLQRITPTRNNPAMKYLSDMALKRFRELYPPPPEIEEVVIPKIDLDRPQAAMGDDSEGAVDVDALVAAFKEGKLEDESPSEKSSVAPVNDQSFLDTPMHAEEPAPMPIPETEHATESLPEAPTGEVSSDEKSNVVQESSNPTETEESDSDKDSSDGSGKKSA